MVSSVFFCAYLNIQLILASVGFCTHISEAGNDNIKRQTKHWDVTYESDQKALDTEWQHSHASLSLSPPPNRFFHGSEKGNSGNDKRNICGGLEAGEMATELNHLMEGDLLHNWHPKGSFWSRLGNGPTSDCTKIIQLNERTFSLSCWQLANPC